GEGQVGGGGMRGNRTATPVPGLSVQLWSSNIPMASRRSMSSYLAGQPDAPLAAPVPGALLTLPSRVPAHATQSWSLTMSVTRVGMRTFGAYPLAAQLTGPGPRPAGARTLLPVRPSHPA